MGGSTTSSGTGTAPSQPNPPKKVAKKQPPQKTVDQLWEAFTTKYPGKVLSILPDNIYAETKAAKSPKGVIHSQKTGKSYDEARAECRHAVDKIAKECRRVNMKYRDPHFDIEFDLKWGKRDTLDGLVPGESTYGLAPKSVKRVNQIFDDPIFIQEGATASDVRQGANGDCWFMSALCALGGQDDLISRVCAARDEKVGVYGFVFHRDGEWIQTIIDDKLFLIAADWDESIDEKWTFQRIGKKDAEEEYRRVHQSGSRALYFAQCRSENETWLPLLEKAYAKAHGDYNSIQGGFTGEAIEDLTGGVTTELFTSDILDTDKFWTDEIMKVNKEFLFGCATGMFDYWQGWSMADRKDIVSMHAYSILEAREIKGERLLRVRNPWGEFEWKGAWSDGSEQWTPEWMQLLNHKFGDDGMFWISYKDLLRKYQSFDRTRLFGPEWHITQQWTTVDVPWTADYNDTKFSLTVTKATPVVVALSKLDDRYFQGLEGQYTFMLHFRLEKDGEPDYIIRSHGNYMMDRSVNVDLDLEPGTYSVLMKIVAKRKQHSPSVEQVIRDTCSDRQDKLIQIGLAYDLAHAKGQIKETEEEKKVREARAAKKLSADHQKRRKELREQWLKNWEVQKKRVARQKRQAKRKEKHDMKVEARKTTAAKVNETVDEASPATAGKDVAEAVDQGVKEDSPNTTETIKEDTPANLKDSPELTNPEPEPTKPEEEPKPDGSKPEETTAVEPEPDESKSDKATLNGGKEKESAGTQPEKDSAAEDKAAQFEAALQNVPSDVDKGTAPVAAGAPGTAAPDGIVPAPSVAADNNDWEYDSLASFSSSIVTELDFPPSPPPEEEAAAPVPAPENPDEEDENAEFENDPWNAVCLVGLKVYAKDKDLTVLIVRPKSDDDEETQLDLDDNSKGASGETTKEGNEEVSTGNTAQDETKAEIKEGAKPGIV